MESARIQVTELGFYVVPLIEWLLVFCCILRRALGKHLIKRRFASPKAQPIWQFVRRLFNLFHLLNIALKLVLDEPYIVIANTRSIWTALALIELPKVVLELLLEQPLRIWIWYLRVLAICLVHLPGSLERCFVVLLKDLPGIQHKIVEVVGRAHHAQWNIIVIAAWVFVIDVLAARGNFTKLKPYLLDKRFVLLRRYLIARGRYVNQSPNQARPSVSDLDRLVCAHEQKRLEAVFVGRAELLVHSHRLVRHQGIEPCVILNPAQIAVVLNGHQRVFAKGLQGKAVAAGAKSLCVKHRSVAIKQLLNHIDDRRFTRARCAIEHHELLVLARIPRYDGSDRPFDLRALLWRI